MLERLGSYEILFCLDPSPDRTEVVILDEIRRNPRIGLLVFSRRFGQPAATMAGILNCRGDWCAVIDVDLQDPPEVIEQLYRKAQEGFDVVAARRSSRAGELTKAAASVSRAHLDAAEALLADALERDAQIFSCGNGGSAAISNHLVRP